MKIFGEAFVVIWIVALIGGWEVLANLALREGRRARAVTIALICAPMILVGYLGIARTPRRPSWRIGLAPSKNLTTRDGWLPAS